MSYRVYVYLKTLTLRGFKSFAAATTLRFEPGINCVVGPNGSGKSNVVDALAWVMGEQGAKNLRGGNMADVIFAGTSKRPALGRAEVSLTIDNSDGVLPIDYTEVTISRTLFRSGGSEYAINGASCRLLDIQELLSDTGMGREMHVIIGQGKLDEVLKAGAEDRRGFIEEAAGVLKHRRRKEKALRKLESMSGSLARIEDLSAELRRQLGPLARQAEAARKAQVMQAEARDAKARLLADDLAQQQARVESHEVDESKLSERRADERARVGDAQARLARLEAEAAAANPKLAALIERWEKASSLEERFRSLGQLAGERQRSLASAARPFHGERPEDIVRRADRARAEEDELRERAATAQDALTAAISEREDAEDAEHRAERERAALAKAAADKREDAAKMAGQISAASSRVEALEAEKRRAGESLEAAKRRADQAKAEVARLEQDIVAGAQAEDPLTERHEANSAELSAAAAALEEARSRLLETRSQTASWEAKVQALKGALAPEDATAWAWENCAGIDGLVRERLAVDGGWETAVEAALAGAASGLAAESLDHPDGARPESAERLVREAIAAAGLGPDRAVPACDVVRASGSSADAIASFLAAYALARDLEAARLLIQAGAPAAATLAGDVIDREFARGGEVSQASILARRAAFESAEREAKKARREAETAEEGVRRCQERLAKARSEHEETGAELAARDSREAAAAAQLGVLRQSLSASRSEAESNASRLDAIDVELRSRREDLESLSARRDAALADPDDLAERAARAAESQRAAHERTRECRHRETEARLALRTGEERLRAVAGRADALMKSAQALAERIEREERQARRREHAAELAGRVADWASRA